MSRKTGSIVGLAALLVLALVMAFWPGETAPVQPSDRAAGPARAAPRAATAGAAASTGVTGPALEREAGATPGDDRPAPHPLTIRLVGLRPAVPCTAPIAWSLERLDQRATSDSGSAPVDADGRAIIELPDWTTAARARLSLQWKNPGYRPVVTIVDDQFDDGYEHRVRVAAVAILEGTVRDQAGAPVQRASISTFASHGSLDSPLGEGTFTDASGAYRVEVAPDLPLTVVAEALVSVFGDQRSMGSFDYVPRGELLPQGRQVTARVDRRTTLDFVLEGSARVTGTLRLADGTPAGKASIGGALQQPHATGRLTGLQRSGDGETHRLCSTVTDDAGRFEVSARAGAPLALRVGLVDGIEIFGPPPTREVVAPADVDFVLPPPTRLRTVTAGNTPTRANVTMVAVDRQVARWSAELTGELQLIATETVRVRAEQGVLVSRWCEVSAATGGTTVDLLLEPGRGAITISFPRLFTPGRATFRCSSDGAPDEFLTGEKLDDGRFRIWLTPGPHRLAIAQLVGDEQLFFTLPAERSVVVTLAPQQLLMPIDFGGRFQLDVRDDAGSGLAGTWRLFAADGRELGAAGAGTFDTATLPNWSPVVPFGDYELEVTVPGHAPLQHRLSLTSSSIKPVLLELP